MKKAIPSLFLLSMLCNCASIVTGSQQSLSVDTANVQGATCNLTNDKGTWYVNSTPASVTVHRSYDALSIICTKNGFEAGNASVKSSTKGMAAGNILFGGIIGGAVDVGTGSAYDYPNMITVPMKDIKAAYTPVHK